MGEQCIKVALLPHIAHTWSTVNNYDRTALHKCTCNRIDETQCSDAIRYAHRSKTPNTRVSIGGIPCLELRAVKNYFDALAGCLLKQRGARGAGNATQHLCTQGS